MCKVDDYNLQPQVAAQFIMYNKADLLLLVSY